jgi:penicillin-binding protein 1A
VLDEPALSDPMRLAAPFDLALPDGTSHRVGDGPDHVRLSRLPRHVAGAFVAAEDARFFRHRGFDPEQIERSLAIDLDSGKLLRGGSTISQQLVKNVFLGPERTLARKLQEAVLTWRMEARLDKKVILERYLDLIELGEGVRGLGAAARYWFARPAEKLSIRQAAFLAALTPAPRTFSRMVRASGGLAPEVAERVDIVLRAMRIAGLIDRAAMERARREPLHLAPAALGRR